MVADGAERLVVARAPAAAISAPFGQSRSFVAAASPRAAAALGALDVVEQRHEQRAAAPQYRPRLCRVGAARAALGLDERLDHVLARAGDHAAHRACGADGSRSAESEPRERCAWSHVLCP